MPGCLVAKAKGRRFEPGVPPFFALVGVDASERFERVSPPSVDFWLVCFALHL